MRLSIEVHGLNIVDRELLRFSERTADISPAAAEIEGQLTVYNRRNFASEGAESAFGRTWPPLSPRYRKWKQKHYPGQPILVRTGALRKSLTETPMGVHEVTRTTIRLGSGLPYARYHQTGGPHLPKRPPIALYEWQKRDLVRTLQRWLVNGTFR